MVKATTEQAGPAADEAAARAREAAIVGASVAVGVAAIGGAAAAAFYMSMKKKNAGSGAGDKEKGIVTPTRGRSSLALDRPPSLMAIEVQELRMD